jgi:glycine/D-amino acid oxidase-like deaminating enzyme
MSRPVERRSKEHPIHNRIGGHTKAASYRSFLPHTETFSLATACKIARLELNNINEVHAFASKHGIPCDSQPCQTVDVIYDPAQWEYSKRAIAAMREAMPGDPVSEYEFHDAETVRERFFCWDDGSDKVSGGIEYAAGSLSAYRLGIGILKLCLAKGLNLQTLTPVQSVTKAVATLDGYRWVVETSRGTILARSVVLATNGYTAFLHKRFQGVIVPLRGQITAQRPGSLMPKPALASTYSFIYENGYDYMIPRPEGTSFAGGIIIGGGLTKAPSDGLEEYGSTDDAGYNTAIGDYLHGTLPRYFGANWGDDDPRGRIRKEWTGIMGYSPDGIPFVGEMPWQEGLWVCAGFQGHGMVYCWMCAKALVEMMEGRDDEALRSWFPDVFRVSEERFAGNFEGRLHVSLPGDDAASTSSRRTSLSDTQECRDNVSESVAALHC